jgi:hypothetical protein
MQELLKFAKDRNSPLRPKRVPIGLSASCSLHGGVHRILRGAFKLSD